MFYRLPSYLTALLLMAFIGASAQNGAQNELPEYVEGELFFKIKPSSGLEIPYYKKGETSIEVLAQFPEIKRLVEPFRIQRIYTPFRTQHPTVQSIYKVEFEKGSMEEIVGSLQEMEEVSYAEPNKIQRLFHTPDDIAPEQTWYMDSMETEKAWDISKGNSDVAIAIVDDAVNISHPDLTGDIYHNPDEIAGDSVDNDGNGYVDDVNGWDAADDDNNPEPPPNHTFYQYGQVYTHGSHTSGIAAAETNNGTGIASIAYNTSIIPIKTVSDNSSFPIGIEAGAEGIDYAISSDADIISMSFGGGLDSTVANLLQVAHADSIFLVAAAGNNGDTAKQYPAALDYVFAVGSTSRGDVVSSFSTYGTWIDVMAPGDSIYSCIWDGASQSSTYGKQSGTSMACPMVASLAGLMLSYDTSATPSLLEHCIKAGAKNIDSINPNYKDSIGAGRINAYASLQCMNSTVGIAEEQPSANDLTVYPNPAHDIVNVNISEDKRIDRVEILDLTGRRIDVIEGNGFSSQKIDVSRYEEQLYLMRVFKDKGGQMVRKLSILNH